jgi:glycosyltransferase involved in cell wall biosynthesis
VASPRISVGMPVYNCDEFVAEAIEGVLKQDFADLELIIADNASTDRTLEICTGYAAQDSRVRILRSEVNRGLAWNFNRVFAATTAEFFMWNAGDDVRLPTMVSRCVEALDADPGAVLAYTGVVYIDAQGEVLRTWPRTHRATAERAAERFADVVLNEKECFPAHGVIRASALSGTALHGNYPSSDNPLLAELALRGRFLELDDDLFLRRDHEGRSMRKFKTPRERNTFFDPSRTGKITLPRWRIGAEYARAVLRAPLEPAERVRCLAVLLPWLVKWRAPLSRQLGSAAAQLAGRAVPARLRQKAFS